MMKPTVTVLMSVYNGEAFVGEAIDSILAQTYRDFELVIIDDASNGATRAVLERFTDGRIRLFRNDENIGLTRSLNRGLAAARGAYVARQDADDRSHRERLARQVCFLGANADAALVGTQSRIIDAAGRVMAGGDDERPLTPLAVQWYLLFGNPFIHTSVMFRRSIILDVLGGYDESYVFNQDFELWSRVLARYPGYNLSERLVDYRSHADSIVGARGDAVIESRRRNVERNKAVQRFNVLRVLGDERLAHDWPEVWTRVGASWVAGAPEKPAQVLPLIRELRARFLRRYPAAQADPDVRRSYAAVLVLAARLLAAHDWFVATQSLLHAAAAAPALAAKAAPRLVAAMVGAKRVRSVMNRLATLIGAGRVGDAK